MLTEGIGSTRSTWLYLGRSYSSRFEHILEVEWLTENHMGRGWRRATMLRYPNQWFRVPVKSSHKPTPRLEVYPALPSKAIPTALPPPACTADCLIKFFDHVGLESFRDMFESRRDQNPSFGKCCNIMRKMGKFAHRSLGSSVDPLESSLTNSVLYLCQIRAVNINTRDVDNSHAICIFNGLIYDANFDRPLDVNEINLDKVCVGDDSWVYDMMVKCATFCPTKYVKRFIFKNLTKTPMCPSLPSKAIPTALPPPECTADCLIKFFDHVGLESFRDMFESRRDQNPSFGKCCNIMRKMGKFAHRSLGSSVDPLESSLTNSVLYLCQIRAVNINTRDVDNSHAICIFNGLIYDANFDRPLDVNEINLDKVCVGNDSWVYDMMVRCATFCPTKNVKRFIFKNLQKTPMNIIS